MSENSANAVQPDSEAITPKRHLSRGLIWTLGAVVGAAVSASVGLVVAPLINKAQDSLGAPFDISTIPLVQTTRVAGGSMWVRDVDALDRLVNTDGRGCNGLWKAGLDAGGVPLGSIQRRLLFHGTTTAGATIVDMTAVVTKHVSLPDGAMIQCYGGGGISPISVNFDLSKTDTVHASSEDPATSFANGYVINVAENEAVPLKVGAAAPSDGAIEWHIVADVVINNEHKLVTIDDNGRPFFTVGSRTDNLYNRGYVVFGANGGLQGEEIIKWGNVGQIDASPTTRIGVDKLSFPWLEGASIYRPLPISPDDESYVLKQNGRPLIDFILPGGGVRYTLPNTGDMCTGAAGPGRYRTVTDLPSKLQSKGVLTLRHRVIEYRCNVGDRRDADAPASTSTDDPFWSCQGTPCPEETQSLSIWEAATAAGNPIVNSYQFWFWSNELDATQASSADALMANVAFS